MHNRFADEWQRPNFPGLLVDFDHFSYDTDKSSAAAGWLMRLQNRADGLWGQIKWTPRGEELLKSGEFRFLSPVWGKAESEKLAEKRFRPTRLESLGLTNQPNLKGMVPLANRASMDHRTDEEADARAIYNDAMALKNRNGISFSEAWEVTLRNRGKFHQKLVKEERMTAKPDQWGTRYGDRWPLMGEMEPQIIEELKDTIRTKKLHDYGDMWKAKDLGLTSDQIDKVDKVLHSLKQKVEELGSVDFAWRALKQDTPQLVWDFVCIIVENRIEEGRIKVQASSKEAPDQAVSDEQEVADDLLSRANALKNRYSIPFTEAWDLARQGISAPNETE